MEHEEKFTMSPPQPEELEKDEINPINVKRNRTMAIVLIGNAIISVILAALVAQNGNNHYSTTSNMPYVVDLVIGVSLLAGSEKWLGFLKFRVIIGGIIFTLISLAGQHYAEALIQMLFGGYFLVLLIGDLTMSKYRLANFVLLPGIVVSMALWVGLSYLGGVSSGNELKELTNKIENLAQGVKAYNKQIEDLNLKDVNWNDPSETEYALRGLQIATSNKGPLLDSSIVAASEIIDKLEREPLASSKGSAVLADYYKAILANENWQKKQQQNADDLYSLWTAIRNPKNGNSESAKQLFVQRASQLDEIDSGLNSTLLIIQNSASKVSTTSQ